jgi:K+-sensing histidine kinase KdpD
MKHATGTKHTLRTHKLTLFAVLSVICAGFIFIGNIFLVVVRDAQVRIVDATIETIPAVLGGTIPHITNDTANAQVFVEDIGNQIPGLVQLDVVLLQEGSYVRVASLHQVNTLVGSVEPSHTARVAQAARGQVVRVTRPDGNVESAYALTDANNAPIGYIEMVFRPEALASPVDRNVVRTMIVLLSVLGVTMALLAWFIGTGEHRRLLKQTKQVHLVYDELLEKVIHEVQTPLTVIAGYTTMLTSLDAGDAVQKHVTHIKRAVEQLQRFLSHATYATLLEQKSIVPNIVSINPLTVVHAVIEVMQKKYNHLNPRITCTTKSSENILVDHKQFSFVLEQVLHNAVFHGGGVVSVRIETEGGDVLVRVIDEGKQGHVVDHKKVTQKWYRGADDTSRLRGSGLGMWLAEKLLLEMRGSLSFVKNTGKGMTVTIRVPQA